jgi:iron complex transport system substrate-binding protein
MGITVVVVEATAFDDIPKSIELVGKIVGMEDVAEQVTADIDAAVKSAQDNQPSEEKTVYYAMSYGDMGNWTSGPGSFINTMIELAGGKCITADQAAPWIEYSLEDLAAADPDIILLDSSMGSTEALAEVAGYKDLTAVRNGNVYAIDADVFTRPGPRIGEAVLEISEILNK